MEVLAVGASVAGLLSLTSQCISGAQNLISLYRDVAQASKTADGFLRDINSLLGTLHDVKSLLGRIQIAQPTGAWDEANLTSLKLQLDGCDRDIGSWLAAAQKCRYHRGAGSRIWFKKFWLAVNADVVHTVRVEIHQRRTEISVALSVLGRILGVEASVRTESIEKSVEHSVDLTQAVLHRSGLIQDVLDRLEQISDSVMELSMGSMRSLNSASSVVSSHGASSGGKHRQSEIHSEQSFNRKASAASDQRLRVMLSAGRARYEGTINEGDNEPGENVSQERQRLERSWRQSQTGMAFPHLCSRCSKKFRSKSQQAQHERTSHGIGYGWSCAATYRCPEDVLLIFHEVDICGYCGERFPRSGRSDTLIRHVRAIHLFNQCDVNVKYFELPSFRKHLQNDHVARPSKHTGFLEDVCLEREPIPIKSADSWVEDVDSRYLEHDPQDRNSTMAEPPILYPAQEELSKPEMSSRVSSRHSLSEVIVEEDESGARYRTHGNDKEIMDKQSVDAADGGATASDHESNIEDAMEAHSLVMSSWDAQLLGEWHNTSDRINRWILHTLGADDSQAKAHRLVFDNMVKGGVEGNDMTARGWHRTLLQYWYLDEAARGSTSLGTHAIESEILDAASLITGSLDNHPPSDPPGWPAVPRNQRKEP